MDAAFLEEIEALARRCWPATSPCATPSLSQRELNFAVQRTIDRIIFLRICEDRGIEPYGQLQALRQRRRASTRRLCELFQQADERYNSGLFHFAAREGPRRAARHAHARPRRSTTSRSRTSSSSLYYPDSPYEFSVLPADILGQVYEQFLGKVIRLTAGHQAVVEDKPEVKKAGGVYYTPTYIVDYIVKHTVGKLLEGQDARSRRPSLRILDPACGSGSFLHRRLPVPARLAPRLVRRRRPGEARQADAIALYQGTRRRVAPHHRREEAHPAQQHLRRRHRPAGRRGDQALAAAQGAGGRDRGDHRRPAQLLPRARPARPGQQHQVRQSLIGPDFFQGRQGELFDDEEALRVNAFDWDKRLPAGLQRDDPGFDAVIGNPPYVFTRELITETERQYYRRVFPTSFEKQNTFLLFMELLTRLVDRPA